MYLYSSIAHRKSCRTFDMTPLDKSMFTQITEAIQGFDRLYPDVPLTYRFSQKVKGRFGVEAPHYLIISGEGKPDEQESAGFLFEQLVLWFDAHEIGSVWLGSSKDATTKNTSHDILTIAFGRSPESIHRTKDQFKRVDIETITNDPKDVRIQALHLAPSGMNTQPWYLEKQDGKILVYQKKLKAPVSLIYKLSDVDMGIGLCHYAVACKKEGRSFRFTAQTDLPEKPGYKPFGTIW